MNTSLENKNLDTLGEEVGNLLPEKIKSQFRASVSKIAETRSETNRAFAVILLGCVWAIAIRGRQESEAAKAEMESSFKKTRRRLSVLIDEHRVIPSSAHWLSVVVSVVIPGLVLATTWYWAYQIKVAAFTKPAGDSTGFSIYKASNNEIFYGVYSPWNPPVVSPADERGWYIVTPVSMPPPLKPPK